ncbi:hypothetical protein [Clostridium sp.]|uniref:hypothetical protein n=1 Tax=Clostridium sp. TaxID=1506 RepID=UPI003F35E476
MLLQRCEVYTIQSFFDNVDAVSSVVEGADVVEKVGFFQGMEETIVGIGSVLENIWGFLEGCAKFVKNAVEVISNPLQTIINIADASYWFFLLTAIVCLILTIAGCKKTKNGAMISFISYIILQCFATVLKGYV